MNNYESLNWHQHVSESDPFTEPRYRQFHRYLPADAENILDIGCNTGRGGQVLKGAASHRTLVGLDVVKDRLDRLPGGTYNETIHGSCTDIPAEDDTFDAIVAGEFIEHLYPRDVDLALCEMFRVLKVGGRILLTTPNPASWKRKLKGESILGGAHVTQHFRSSLTSRLRMVGYSNIHTMGSGKASLYIGYHFPVFGLYGSYMVYADKF